MLISFPGIIDDNNDRVETKYVPNSVISVLIGYLHSYKNPMIEVKLPLLNKKLSVTVDRN